jgi:hypothetical protein
MESDCGRFLDERCCRSPRVWIEPARLLAAYRAWGGRMSEADLLAALQARGAWRSRSGLVCGIGLREDWGPEDGGERPARSQREEPP